MRRKLLVKEAIATHIESIASSKPVLTPLVECELISPRGRVGLIAIEPQERRPTMVERATWSGERVFGTGGLEASAEELRCDACWVLIQQDQREAYEECGLCRSCDAYLNPYPRQPRQDDPRAPGSYIC